MVLELTLKAFSAHNWVIRAAERGLSTALVGEESQGAQGVHKHFICPLTRRMFRQSLYKTTPLPPVLCWLAGRLKGRASFVKTRHASAGVDLTLQLLLALRHELLFLAWPGLTEGGGLNERADEPAGVWNILSPQSQPSSWSSSSSSPLSSSARTL